MNRHLGLRMVNLPGNGDAEGLARLLGKHIPIAALGVATAKPQIEAGKLRVIMSFDTPKDFGLPGSTPDLVSLYGKDFPDIENSVYIFVPAKTPEHIVRTLEKMLQEVSKNPEYIGDLAKIAQVVNFVPGKIATERANKKAELIRAVVADQPKPK
jgi:tripartite-type tricarboxylate transporter receptor subunit TctC